MAGKQVTPIAPIPRGNRHEQRITSSIRVSERVWLYAKERYNVAQTIEHMLRTALQNDSVDLSKPHPDEFYGYDAAADGLTQDTTKPLTFREAQAKGLLTPSTDEIERRAAAEPEGAVL